MTRKRLTDSDYTDLALDVKRGDIHPVAEPVYGDTALRRGRPSGRSARRKALTAYLAQP